MKLKAMIIVIAFAALSQSVWAQGTEAVFSYDKERITDAKPWTDKQFQNDPEEFQFAIIGDRTGGANVQGTFERAMAQLNLLQPEFVINVGDIIEGYTKDKAELHAQWEEAEGMTSMLGLPFFYTRGNHDVSYPEAREVWKERHGPGLLSLRLPQHPVYGSR